MYSVCSQRGKVFGYKEVVFKDTELPKRDSTVLDYALYIKLLAWNYTNIIGYNQEVYYVLEDFHLLLI